MSATPWISIRIVSKATNLIPVGLLAASLAVLARERPPDVPPPKPIVVPIPQVQELPNGLKLVVIERRSLPVLTLRLVVKSGAEADPPDLPGTAQLTAELLSQGTSRRSARQIAETVDDIGGSLETGASWDDSYAELTVLADQTDLAFELIADVVRHPAFAPEEIERKRKQTLSALEVLRDDPGFTADALFQVLIFSGTPYGHPLDGTEESVRRISRNELEGFHAQHYLPSNCVLAAVGDIAADSALERARKFFGDWPASSHPPSSRTPGAERRTERRIVVVDKPDAVQTEIRIGNLAAQRDSPDYDALTVANQVLGGPAANRLFKTLRSRLGLAYGASSDLICQQTAGSWVARTSTRTGGTARSVQAILEEMDRLRSRPISAGELRTAQNYLIGHMALRFESSADVAAETLEIMVHDLPLDYWGRFPGRLSALDEHKVFEVARRYLDPDRSVVVLVGDARKFASDVRRFGPIQVVPMQDLDLASPNLRRRAAASGP
jgi:zinc protease